ncbi:MAG TPA: hypothetical protein VEU96_12630 [Bryobacteraceae bacterium]|nr:hypothetical protein [Bryobacteraceae bacterium]
MRLKPPDIRAVQALVHQRDLAWIGDRIPREALVAALFDSAASGSLDLIERLYIVCTFDQEQQNSRSPNASRINPGQGLPGLQILIS